MNKKAKPCYRLALCSLAAALWSCDGHTTSVCSNWGACSFGGDNDWIERCEHEADILGRHASWTTARARAVRASKNWPLTLSVRKAVRHSVRAAADGGESNLDNRRMIRQAMLVLTRSARSSRPSTSDTYRVGGPRRVTSTSSDALSKVGAGGSSTNPFKMMTATSAAGTRWRRHSPSHRSPQPVRRHPIGKRPLDAGVSARADRRVKIYRASCD